jgi:transposase
MYEYNTALLGIQGIDVDSFQETETTLEITIGTRPKQPPCPCCKTKHCTAHDYRLQRVKDLSFRGKIIILILKKRRYRCKACGKRFFETYSFLPRYHHMTQRVYTHILRALRSNRSMKSVAEEYAVSTNTVARVFDIVSYSLHRLPTVLAIDEFKGNSGGQKYHAILTDPSKQKLLDIIQSREQHTLFEYFGGFKQREHIKFFVMDMWEPYKNLAKHFFPNATIVIDKYHYVRQVYWALDRVRKRVQKRLTDEGRLTFKRSRRLFYMDSERLSDEQRQRLDLMLSKDDDLFTAWQLKELFKKFNRCTDYRQAEKRLREWILTAQEAKLPEFKDCITAFLNWFRYILNSKLTPLTNAFTEGKNNKIKVLKRNAYGYRNFHRFRNRILHCG